jgi:phospholipid/cholesterol/gamma-HCH transport system substrate-binding protein
MRRVLISVGVFVGLLAIALWVANLEGLLLGYAELRTFMDDASGLTDGTKVRLNGIPVGYLDRQHLTGSRDHSHAVEFNLKVKASYLERIPIDSRVRVVADNLLSDKAINIIPGTAAQHVESGAELQAGLEVDPNKMMAQMSNTLQQFQHVVDRANSLLAGVDAGQGSAGKLMKSWQGEWSNLPIEMRKLVDDYSNANGTAHKLLVDNSELTEQIQTTQKRFDDIVAAFQGGQGTAGKLAGFHKDLDPVMHEIDELKVAIKTRTGSVNDLQQRLDNLMSRFSSIMDKANSGQGTFGQLLVNPQLSQALAGTGREFQTLAKDLRANPKKFLSLRLALF